MNTRAIVVALVLTGCTTPRPVATVIDEPESEPAMDAPAKPSLPRAIELTTAHGPVVDVGYGFSSEEGDRCSLRLSHNGWLFTESHVWSGFECPWPRGGRRYPLDDAGREALQARLGAVTSWQVATPDESHPGLEEHARVQLGADVYILPPELEEELARQAQRIIGVWAPREAAGFEQLIVVDSTPQRHVRVLVQPHGIAVRTADQGEKRTEGVQIFDDATWARLQTALAALPKTPADADDAVDAVLVNFNGVALRYRRGETPPSVLVVHDIVLGVR